MWNILATQHLATAAIVPFFKEYLALCKVKKGETLLIFTDSEFNQQYPAAFLGAARELGAEAIIMTVRADMTRDELRSKTIMDAWKSADMVIALTTTGQWLYSEAHNEALDTGVRTLMAQSPLPILRRLFPCKEVRGRTLNGASLLEKGKTIRITSEAGTDLTMSKEGRIAAAQYGLSDTKGRWDHWPAGLVSCAPVEGTGNGTMVVDVGDILLRLRRHVQSPITLTIRDGNIVKFEGEGADRKLLEDYFAAAKEKNAYQISHIGWGTEHRALWGNWGMDAESFYGNMQIAFGSNFLFTMKGKNVCNFHFDIPCRNHSFYVDDQLVVDKGKIVVPGLE